METTAITATTGPDGLHLRTNGDGGGSAVPYTVMKDGIRLAVRVTPNASRNGLDGVTIGPDNRPMLQLRLTAPPVDGAANSALVEFLAGELGMRRSAIRIFSGETARLKRLELEGEPSALVERLNTWIKKAEQGKR